MVTPETLKLMVLLVEDGLVDEHVVDVLDDGPDVDVAAARGWWPCG
jgi:arginine/ornithine N-succinyltransferase beta subunit